MKIILIGYMGSGKSAVGEMLANVLKTSFLDLDHLIEAREGRTISEIFSTNGEIYFRKIEANLLRETIEQNNSFVLATGGGTPCYAGSMEYLKSINDDVKTIYLNVSLPVLTDRLFSEKDKRPLISHLESKTALEDFIRKHLFERVYYYQQSEIKLTINSESIREIVEKIVLQLL